MRTSPPIAPTDADRDVYLVLDDFGGRLGRVWRETDEANTDRAAVIRGLLEGHTRTLSASSPSTPQPGPG